MIIYLNTKDMRSYALTPNVNWETIEVEVSEEFEGGGKKYDLKTKTWINDVIPELSAYEIKTLKETQALEQKRQIYFDMEATIQRLERIRDRDDSEQAELDALIDESTKLFREIRAEKEKLNDRNA